MRRSLYPAIILLCLLTAALGAIWPLYIIWPFRPQRPDQLQMALAVLRYRWVAEAIAVVLCGGAVYALWRTDTSRRTRVLSGIAAVLVLGLAGFSRVNIFEVLFHPIGKPSFEPAAAAKLNGDEKVLSVRVGNTARAYPVRGLSYHHVVNDVLEGVAVAATY